MSTQHHAYGPSPDRGPAPANRLAPDTPAEIANDLARLVAESAARWAARNAAGKSITMLDLRSPDELLAEIRATITGQAGAPLPSLSSALAGRRAIFGAFNGEATRG